MYRLVYKNFEDTNWKYSNWSTNISDLNFRLAEKEFFVQNKNYLIVYSS